MLWALLAQPLEQRVCAMQSSGCALRYIFLKDRALALQFLGISFVVGKEALGHIQAEQGAGGGRHAAASGRSLSHRAERTLRS